MKPIPWDWVQETIPPLSTEEQERLRADIEARGVRVPIHVLPDGRIIDGYHRWKLSRGNCEHVVRKDIGDELEAKAEAIRLNLNRRNLSNVEKQHVRERQREINRELRAQGLSQERRGIVVGVAQQTIADWDLADRESVSVTGSGNANTKDPRAKIDPQKRPEILRLVDAGVPQEQIVRDLELPINRSRVAQIAAEERRRREHERDIEEQRKALGGVVSPDGPFDVISIDPPWPYGTRYDPAGMRGACPYPEMSLEEIAALPIGDKAADDCILWLWTTHAFMRPSFGLLDAWGFQEKVILTWAKDRMGLGKWLRSQSEFCIMAVRGSPQIKLTNQTTVLHGKMREHSRKPEEFYALVEELCLGTRRVDWFSREPREGWLQFGNDTERFVA